MNNLNITQNSNDLNESENTQEKLYSNEVSMDDLLTYSEDISQNANKNSDIDILKNKKIPIIQSFNSEVTMSFLNNQNDVNYSNKEYHPKTDFKNNNFNIGDKKNIIKNCSDCKLLSLSKSDIFNYKDNDKDISGINESMNNLLSEFDIKDISLSKRRSGNFNIMEKNNYNISGIKNNNNWMTIKSENLFIKKNKENFIYYNHISTPLNDNKNQIIEDHSNTNSMCNYQNLSNLNDISSNKNLIKKDEKNNKENNFLLKNKTNDLNIKLNISLDNYKDNKFHENKYPYEIIDEDDIDKRDNFKTSSKKENSFFFTNKISKILKNSLKYTKAQCVNPLLQNNTNPNKKIKNNKENKQFFPSDNPIIIKDTVIDKNCQNLTNQKVPILSSNKLSFEIQKNDCIEITINNNQNDDLSKFNDNNSHLSISRAYDFRSSNNYFYSNEFLKKNNTTSFIIFPKQYNNNSIQNNKIKDNFNSQKKNLIHKYIQGNKKIYINNKNINVGKGESNNFFYNPKNIIVNKASSITNNKKNFLNDDKIKIENELHTPDSNKNKVAPMTCVHKGSFVYCQDNSQNNNSVKYNYINNYSKIFKNNNSSLSKNNNNQKSNKTLIQKNSNLKYTKINKRIKNNLKKCQNGIKNKNSTFIKVKNNKDCFKTIIKREKNMGNKLKTDEKKFINTKEFYPIHNNINKTIKNDLKKNKNTNNRNNLNNNNNTINSINSVNNRKNIINKIREINKNNKFIEKINNDFIKESSLFSLLYNSSQKNISKNISRKSSNNKMKDTKDLTIIQNKNDNKMKIKVKKGDNINLQKNKKNISDKKYENREEKKLVRHNTNNLSEFNLFFEKVLDASNKKIKLSSKRNIDLKKKNSFNKINYNKSNNKKAFHKKINSQINLNALTNNFNFINQKRRKNNKSLYNFGNIFFINQNKIIENNYESFNSNINNNSNITNFISKNNNNDKQQKIKTYEVKKNENQIENNKNNLKEKKNNNEINPLNISSIKKTPEIITDFSKYKKKKEYRSHFMSMVERIHPTLNEFNVLNKLDNNCTQLISEH